MALIVGAIVVATGLGFRLERRMGASVARAARRSLLWILYTVLPFVTFFNLAHAEFNVDNGVGLILAWAAILIAAGLAWVIASRIERLSQPAVGAVVVCVLLANTGYLGYPLAHELLGDQGLTEAVLYDVMVQMPILLILAFSVGAMFGDRAGETPRERVKAFFARNPVLYAAIAGLLAPESLAPDVLVDISRIFIVAILPIGFFAVGASLAEESDEGRVGFPPAITLPVVTAVGMRLAVVPALLFCFSAPLIDLPDAYLLQAAMPCGLNSMIVAEAYGLDVRIIAAAITWSTVIAVAVVAVTQIL
jgi:predicted permease